MKLYILKTLYQSGIFSLKILNVVYIRDGNFRNPNLLLGDCTDIELSSIPFNNMTFPFHT